MSRDARHMEAAISKNAGQGNGAQPDCGAVAHLHSACCVALSCCLDLNGEDCIRPSTPYYVMHVAPLPLLPYCKPGGAELVRLVAEKAATARCFLLANHGSVVTGATLEDAVNAAEEPEETAKLFFLLQQEPEKRVRYLDTAQIQARSPKF
jgi:ribulose-5-phosphate 4-epimerase/fuculose-1-phosphate aldolase